MKKLLDSLFLTVSTMLLLGLFFTLVIVIPDYLNGIYFCLYLCFMFFIVLFFAFYINID